MSRCMPVAYTVAVVAFLSLCKSLHGQQAVWGGSVILDTSGVVVGTVRKESSFYVDLFLFSPQPALVAGNMVYPEPFSLGQMSAGTDLGFRVHAWEPGDESAAFDLFTGPGTFGSPYPNPDGKAHATVLSRPNHRWLVRFWRTAPPWPGDIPPPDPMVVIDLAVVPEPSTAVLLCAGCLALLRQRG